MPKKIELPSEEDLEQFVEEITARNHARANKFQSHLALIIEAQKRIQRLGRLSDQVEDSDDLLRAIVVLNHAYLEDFLRTLGRELLPFCDEATLDEIPVAKNGGRKEKFYLGKLAQFRGYMVDDLIDESVMEHLDKRSFSSHGEIIVFLNRLEIKINARMKRQLITIGKMIQRRHQIVHRADRVVDSGKLKPQLQTITARRVIRWVVATNRFMIKLAEMHVRMS